MGEELSFFDVKSKKKFKTSEYRIVDRKGRFFAVTKYWAAPLSESLETATSISTKKRRQIYS